MTTNSDGNVDLNRIMASKPSSLHKGSARTRPECDITAMIERSGCSKVYYDLEECLGEHDRNWSKCQVEVHALQMCSKKKI